MNKLNQSKNILFSHKLALSMLIYLGSSTLLISKTLAQQVGTYTFNKHIGEVYVGVVEVSYRWMEGRLDPPSGCGGPATFACAGQPFKGHGTRLSANLGVPSCPNQHHLEGYVTVKYKNGGAFITRTYPLGASDEGRSVNPSWTLRGNYGNPSTGNLNVETQSKCVYHGVNHQGGSRWSPWNW